LPLLLSRIGGLSAHSDETCLVVGIEPTGKEKGITKIGKDSYPTAEQAEADVKRICKSEAKPKRNP